MRQVATGGRGSTFGVELRRLRAAKGVSLRDLAGLVFYTPGHLSKVENGERAATSELAARCDEVLEAHGQLVALADSSAFPRVAQLPAVSASFIGRVNEIAQLSRALMVHTHAGAPRLVAVDGLPGVGKTALVTRIAHEVSESFPDGQLYLDLHGHSPDARPRPVDGLLEEVLLAIGAQPGTLPSGVEQRAGLYRSILAGRRVLLVLDNAFDSEQVAPLLPGSDLCGVVVTSRRRLSGLGLTIGHRVTLDPLPGQDAVDLLRRVVGEERVDGDLEAALDLTQHCGGLPLALRIAAERVASHPHRSMRDLAGELAYEDQRLDALSDEDPSAVRTAFAWSYRDLGTAQARMFRLMGLGWAWMLGVEAAAALAGVSVAEARRLLDGLTAVHLAEQVGADRYRMHDLLRVYAAHAAMSEETDAERTLAVSRLLDWYLHSTYAANHVLAPQRHDPGLEAPRTPVPVPSFNGYDEALAWCEVEAPNIVAAARLAFDLGEDTTAWRLPIGSFNYIHLSKRWAAWAGAHEVAVHAARRCGDREGEAWAVNNLGIACRELHRLDTAAEHVTAALAIRRELDDVVGEAWSLTALGFVDADRRRFDESAGHFHEAARIFDRIGERYGEEIALANLGDVHRWRHRHDRALRYLDEALTIAEDLGDRHGMGYVLARMGATYQQMRRFDDALHSLDRSLAERRAVGDRLGEGETLIAHGHVLAALGRPDAARTSWQQALSLYDELDDPQAHTVRALLDPESPVAG